MSPTHRAEPGPLAPQALLSAEPTPASRRRILQNAELRRVILHLAAQAPLHGYQLIRSIETLSRGVYAPSPGVLYPTLAALADEGLLEEQTGEEQGGRRVYGLTRKGRGQRTREQQATAEILERLDALGAQRDRVEVAPVRRAMEGLKGALFDALAGEPERRRILEVAAILDDAKQRIEALS